MGWHFDNIFSNGEQEVTHFQNSPFWKIILWILQRIKKTWLFWWSIDIRYCFTLKTIMYGYRWNFKIVTWARLCPLFKFPPPCIFYPTTMKSVNMRHGLQALCFFVQVYQPLYVISISLIKLYSRTTLYFNKIKSYNQRKTEKKRYSICFILIF